MSTHADCLACTEPVLHLMMSALSAAWREPSSALPCLACWLQWPPSGLHLPHLRSAVHFCSHRWASASTLVVLVAVARILHRRGPWSPPSSFPMLASGPRRSRRPLLLHEAASSHGLRLSLAIVFAYSHLDSEVLEFLGSCRSAWRSTHHLLSQAA